MRLNDDWNRDPARRSLRLGQRLVGAVAERWIGGVFALAPPHRLFFGDLEFHRLKAGALVGAITKRLARGASARTPPISPRFDFQGQWLRITNYRFFAHKWATLHPVSAQREEETGKSAVGVAATTTAGCRGSAAAGATSDF